MASDRPRTLVAGLLYQAQGVADRGDWEKVREHTLPALRFEPGNSANRPPLRVACVRPSA